MTQLKSNVDGHPIAAETPTSFLDTIVQAIDGHDKELQQINRKVLFLCQVQCVVIVETVTNFHG
jgi:hypothetical protein